MTDEQRRNYIDWLREELAAAIAGEEATPVPIGKTAKGD